VSQWIEVGAGHRVQLLDNGGVLWEHDTPEGYRNGSYLIRRHEVSPVDGATWTVVQREPLTLSPSLHCDPAVGGCGAHGFIRDGKWA
jgi:hypothetical protein